MSEEQKEDNIDIFKAAAEESIKQTIPQNNLPVVIDKDEQQKLAEYKTENPDDEWSKVEKAMTGRFAKKFMDIMEELPDRDFMRVYLKAIEFFKPKVVRAEPKLPGDDDTTIQVNIMQVNDKGDIVTLKLNNETETYE